MDGFNLFTLEVRSHYLVTVDRKTDYLLFAISRTVKVLTVQKFSRKLKQYEVLFVCC